MKLQNRFVMNLSVQDLAPNPNQPRTRFENGALRTLAASIRENGMLQPISVRRRKAGGYEIIAGERRFRAAILAGFSTVPCIVLEKTDAESAVLALLENIQRENLNCFEEAEAYAALMKEGTYNQSALAAQIGKAPCTLANKLRLLKYTAPERKRILELNLTERHARAILALPEEQERNRMIELAGRENWTVAQTEKAVEKKLAAPKKKAKRIYLIKDVRIFMNTIRQAMDGMSKAGVAADCSVRKNEAEIVYEIRIPLKGGQAEKENRPALCAVK